MCLTTYSSLRNTHLEFTSSSALFAYLNQTEDNMNIRAITHLEK